MDDGMYGISQMMNGMLNGLTGNSGKELLNVAFVVCAFVSLIVRPDGIANRARFRSGCGVFAISLLIPGFAMLLAGNMGESSGAGAIFFYSSVLSSLLFSLAFYLTVTSLISARATPGKDN